MVRRCCCGAVLVVACASTKDVEHDPVTTPPSFEQRLAAADPSWRPKDPAPTERALQRWISPRSDDSEPQAPPGVKTVQIAIHVEIRNRCTETATFIVGPEQHPPPRDAPTNQLLPGEAITTTIASNELLRLRAPDGRYTLTAPADNFIVFLGDPTCNQIWHGR